MSFIKMMLHHNYVFYESNVFYKNNVLFFIKIMYFTKHSNEEHINGEKNSNSSVSVLCGKWPKMLFRMSPLLLPQCELNCKYACLYIWTLISRYPYYHFDSQPRNSSLVLFHMLFYTPSNSIPQNHTHPVQVSDPILHVRTSFPECVIINRECFFRINWRKNICIGLDGMAPNSDPSSPTKEPPPPSNLHFF